MTSEVFGRPIEGEIRPTSSRTSKQADPMKLIEVLDTLLALPGVIEYKWIQYTPYWMDGEECEFGVISDWNAGVKLEFGNEDGGEAGDGYYESLSSSYYPELNEKKTLELEKALSTLSRELGRGAHDVWLKETFGDHATVYATKEGFRVEFYEHD